MSSTALSSKEDTVLTEQDVLRALSALKGDSHAILQSKRRELDGIRNFLAELDTLHSTVQGLDRKLRHPVMVPLGPLAFVPGELIHTNEFTVHLGAGQYSEMTRSETLEFIERRQAFVREQLAQGEKGLDALRTQLGQAAGEDQEFGLLKRMDEAGNEVLEIREEFSDASQPANVSERDRVTGGPRPGQPFTEEELRAARERNKRKFPRLDFEALVAEDTAAPSPAGAPQPSSVKAAAPQPPAAEAPAVSTASGEGDAKEATFSRPPITKRVSWADRMEAGPLATSEKPTPPPSATDAPLAAVPSPSSASSGPSVRKGGLKKGFLSSPKAKTQPLPIEEVAPPKPPAPRRVVEIGSVVERDAIPSSSSSASASTSSAVPPSVTLLSPEEFVQKNRRAHTTGVPIFREFEPTSIEDYAAASGGFIPAEVVRSLELPVGGEDEEDGRGEGGRPLRGANPAQPPSALEAEASTAQQGKKLSKFKQRMMGLAE